jgi:hypothetical protein
MSQGGCGCAKRAPAVVARVAAAANRRREVGARAIGRATGTTLTVARPRRRPTAVPGDAWGSGANGYRLRAQAAQPAQIDHERRPGAG